MNLKLKTLALAISLSAGSISLPTLAMPISVQVESSVILNDNGMLADSDGPSSSAHTELLLNNSFGKATGDSNGNSLLRANTTGTASSALSTVHQLATITNNTASAQNFTFNFLINNGSLSAYSNSPLASGEFLSSSYSANILLNGTSLWSSSATLNTDANGSSLTTADHVLGSYSSGSSYYSWGAVHDSLNLGTFASGETFTLDYFITNSAQASATPVIICSDHGYGGGYQQCDFSYQRSGAGFGDPFGFETTADQSPMDNNSIIATPVASLPEPAGIALLGAGLLGLAYRRRAKKSV